MSDRDGLEEFTEQIDSRLRQLLQRENFVSAMRVQSLSAVTFLWSAYEALRNELTPIAKKHGIVLTEHSVVKENVIQLQKLKEHRNLILHGAAIVDARFSNKVGQRIGEKLELQPHTVSSFFDCVANVGTTLLEFLSSQIHISSG
jgi:hypothetical protein